MKMVAHAVGYAAGVVTAFRAARDKYHNEALVFTVTGAIGTWFR